MSRFNINRLRSNRKEKAAPTGGPLFQSDRQRLTNFDAGGNAVVTMPFANDHPVLALMAHHNTVTITMTPAVVMAAVLLDHDGLRAGGIARHRQSDTNGSDSSKSQDNLTHASSPSGLNNASTRKAGPRSILFGSPKLKACSSKSRAGRKVAPWPGRK
jgi:hypothetical protein